MQHTERESLDMLLLYIDYLPGKYTWSLELPLDTTEVSGYYGRSQFVAQNRTAADRCTGTDVLYNC